MATINEIDAQIRQLEEQKKQLQEKAKDAAMKKATDAIEELRSMGFSYRLTSDVSPPRRAASPSGGGRRTGQRETVLALVKGSAGGISAAEVLTKSGASDDAEKTSVRNALAALKRTGAVDLKDGKYTAK